jgi:hypothetical protein
MDDHASVKRSLEGERFDEKFDPMKFNPTNPPAGNPLSIVVIDGPSCVGSAAKAVPVSGHSEPFLKLGDVSAESAARGAASDRDPMAEFDLSSLLPSEPPSSHEIVVTFRIQIGGGRRR